jgi:glycosyltransferase involved in cell wall biosynthesis
VVSRGVSGQLVGEAIVRRSRKGAGPGAVHVMNEHTPLTPEGRLVAPRPHQRALTRLVSRAVDAVVAVTQRQVPPLEALGYPRGRIDVVPNGVFERHVQGVEPSRDLDSGGFAVLCVSGLRPEKRVDLFIEAVAAARRENAAIRGYVAGEGPERERLERLAEGSGVALLGVRRDVLELIRAADAVCLPSEAEALPMSILEAMALERPVVATDVGGTAEQVVDGETGYLVPAGGAEPIQRALLALSADPTRAREMGAAGRRRQRERFGGEAMVDGYLRAFEEAVRRGQA